MGINQLNAWLHLRASVSMQKVNSLLQARHPVVWLVGTNGAKRLEKEGYFVQALTTMVLKAQQGNGRTDNDKHCLHRANVSPEFPCEDA